MTDFKIRPYQRNPTKQPAFVIDALRKAVEAGDIAYNTQYQMFYHVKGQFLFEGFADKFMRECEQAGLLLRGGSVVRWKQE